MATTKTSKRSSIKLFILLFCIFVILAILTFFVIKFFVNHTETIQPVDTVKELDEQPESKPEEIVNEINFNDVINEWVTSVNGNKSILIYDLKLDKIVGSFNESENYGTASLYKLFVVYEGYRRIESGEWNKDAPAGSTGRTILECLDLAIRESHSPCAETLWSMIGHTELDQIIKNDFNITNSDVSHLVSNPTDIMKIMKLFYEHPDINNPELLTRIKDSFLIQPVTTYNWRQGLPSGFNYANVYNKVGWAYNASRGYWDIYHDTAIIEFPQENRDYIVVVMTNFVPFEKITELGTKIENHFLQNN